MVNDVFCACHRDEAEFDVAMEGVSTAAVSSKLCPEVKGVKTMSVNNYNKKAFVAGVNGTVAVYIQLVSTPPSLGKSFTTLLHWPSKFLNAT